LLTKIAVKAPPGALCAFWFWWASEYRELVRGHSAADRTSFTGHPMTEAKTRRQSFPFAASLADAFGCTLAQAEVTIREARMIGLIRPGARRWKVWTVDDVAAIIATFLLVRASGNRDAGLVMLHDPARQRGIMNRIGTALQLGDPIEFEFKKGDLSVTVRLSGLGVRRLADLVGDWSAHASPPALRVVP